MGSKTNVIKPKSEKKKKNTTKVIQSTDGKTRVSSSKIDLPAAKPCKDTEGETDISIAGKPATCAKLAPYCKYAQFKKQVSKFCPKTCGVCKDAHPSSKSASAVKGKSKTKKKSATKVIKSEKKKKSTTKVIQSEKKKKSKTKVIKSEKKKKSKTKVIKPKSEKKKKNHDE